MAPLALILLEGAGRVMGPPSADTDMNGVPVHDGVNRMRLPRIHAAPGESASTSQMTMGSPPATATFFSLPSA